MRLALSSTILTVILALGSAAETAEYGSINGWGKLIDSDGDCAFIVSADGITIQVPDSTHDLSVELRLMNAPRVLQRVEGDFSIEVEVGGSFAPRDATIDTRAAYNGAGILLWQDEKNYIRLERAALRRGEQARHYVNFESRINGRNVRFGQPTDFEADATKTCYLRLQRKGQRFLGAVRQTDDDDWIELTPKNTTFAGPLEVGVAAINASNMPFSPSFHGIKLEGAGTAIAKSPSPAKEDPYAVPETGADDLVAFIEKIRSMRPRTRDEYTSHLRRSPEALKAAVDRLLDMDDAPPEALELAQRIGFEQEVRAISRLDDSAQRQLLKRISDFCAESREPLQNISLVTSLARGLEYAKQSEMAAEAYEMLSDVLRKQDTKALTQQAETMAGAARRMRLLGNKMELEGTTLEGKPFSLDEYAGKVVLVDFWATWCGPCVAEIPNVKTYYELYHDRGFEVVGISLDSSRSKLESFVEAKKIPWINLYEEEAGSSQPAAVQYGVMAIPTVILVNREGNAVSLSARGKELGRLLEEELGPVDPEKLLKTEDRIRGESAAMTPRRPATPTQSTEAPWIVHQDSAIYMAARNGGDFRRLHRVDDYQWHGSPSISPNGRQVAWNAHKEKLTNPSVFVGDLNGNIEHIIEGATRPVWLDDETLIAEKDGTVLKVNLTDNLKQEELLEGLHGALSPNRRFLVYARSNDAVVRNLETGVEKVCSPTPQARAFNGFAISNDGKRLAYVGNADRGQGIYIADVNDAVGKEVANPEGQEHFPVFAPEGNELLFTAGSIVLDENRIVSRIHVVDLDTGKSGAVTGEDFYCRDPSWSPDGQFIVFTAVSKEAVDKVLSRNQPPKPTAAGMKASNELKKIGLAFHNHHSAYKRLPPSENLSNSKLSWRVHLLPFLGEQRLYGEFKLDEPWDSEHNRMLIEKMPEVFGLGAGELSRKGMTRVVRPFHEKAMYHDKSEGSRFREVLDGLSNTIMTVIADSDRAVIWTCPDDLEIDLDHPKEGWTEGIEDQRVVLFADGRVLALPNELPDEIVGHLLTRAGKEIISGFKP